MLDKIINNIMFRLGIYYMATIAIIFGLFNLFPQIPYYLALERGHQARMSFSELGTGVPSALEGRVDGLEGLLDPATSIPVLMALVLSFALALPVTWVYRWTHNKKKYAQTFAHTLLVLPIAIASVVFLVKGSLALAFSLAGIVAAVRFRTTLNDPMDGVFIFIVAGIGLAAGVQLLNVAFIASVIFNFIAVAVWYTDFGARPAVLDGCKLVQPEEPSPIAADDVVQPVVLPVEPNGKKPFNAQLLIHTKKVDISQQTTIPILESNAIRWRLAPVIPKEDGTSIVVFDVRLKKSKVQSALVGEVEKSDKKYIVKVEVKKHKPVKA